MRQSVSNNNQLGTYLRMLRQARGLSTYKLAGKINRAPAYLTLIEHGARGIKLFDLWRIVSELDGDFQKALRLLCKDQGIPPEALQ